MDRDRRQRGPNRSDNRTYYEKSSNSSGKIKYGSTNSSKKSSGRNREQTHASGRQNDQELIPPTLKYNETGKMQKDHKESESADTQKATGTSDQKQAFVPLPLDIENLPWFEILEIVSTNPRNLNEWKTDLFVKTFGYIMSRLRSSGWPKSNWACYLPIPLTALLQFNRDLNQITNLYQQIDSITHSLHDMENTVSSLNCLFIDRKTKEDTKIETHNNHLNGPTRQSPRQFPLNGRVSEFLLKSVPTSATVHSSSEDECSLFM